MSNKRNVLIGQVIVLLGIAVAAMYTTSSDASEMQKGEAYWIKKLNEIRGPSESFKTSIRLSSYEDDKLIQEGDVDIFFNGNKNVLIAFRSPALDVGRKILVEGNNMWLATPTSSRILRIHPSQRLVGASSNVDAVNYDFSNYQLMQESPVNNERTDGKSMTRVALQALDHKQPYRTIEFYVDQATHYPHISLHYAASGKLLKTIHYESFKDGLVEQLRTIDPVNVRQSTLMVYTNYESETFPPAIFKKRNLLELNL